VRVRVSSIWTTTVAACITFVRTYAASAGLALHRMLRLHRAEIHRPA
jgi:hypothetical protein